MIVTVAITASFVWIWRDTRPLEITPPEEPIFIAAPAVRDRESGTTKGVLIPKRGPMPDSEWTKILTPEEFRVIRKEGTERPFSSPLDHETRPGTYYSVDCGVALFRSEQKYDSGTGWPSFWAPIDPTVVTLVTDEHPLLGQRIEVRDSACDGHLGHVFDDGPPPTGKRYCMNGIALRFVPDEPAQ